MVGRESLVCANAGARSECKLFFFFARTKSWISARTGSEVQTDDGPPSEYLRGSGLQVAGLWACQRTECPGAASTTASEITNKVDDIGSSSTDNDCTFFGKWREVWALGRKHLKALPTPKLHRALGDQVTSGSEFASGQRSGG